jgi:D-alanyl-D-alanine carboxypeptidase (penicillin-binding protein 5/6)
MAVITRYALKNEEFVRIINTPNADFTTNKKHYAFANKDRLLNEYEGAIGVKTGFTGKAGHCFVGAAKRGDRQLISVVLASGWGSVGKSRKWSDTKAILDYGFNNFEKTPIIQKGDELSAVCLDRARESSVPLAAEKEVSILMKKGENVDYKLKIDKPYFISAPVKKGDAVGKADVYVNGNKIGETKLVATRDIERFCFEDNFKNIFKKWFLVE